MIETTIKCERCGHPRLEGNHWLELRFLKGVPYFLPWSKQAERRGRSHVCGSKCAHIILDKYLAGLVEKRTSDSQTGH